MILSTADAQAALAKLGYYRDAIDGDYASQAFRSAVRRLQRDHVVAGDVDGWYGPKTDLVLAPLAHALRRHAPPELRACERWTLGDYVVGDVRAHGLGQVPLFDDQGAVIAQVAAGAYVQAVMLGETLLADGQHAVTVAGWRDVGPEQVLYKPVLGIAKRNHWVPGQPRLAGIELSNDGLIVRRVRTWTVQKLGSAGWPVSVRTPFMTALAPHGSFEIGEHVFVLELAGVDLPNCKERHTGWLTIGGFTDDTHQHLEVFTGTPALRGLGPIARLQHVHLWAPRFDLERCPLCRFVTPDHATSCPDHPVPRI